MRVTLIAIGKTKAGPERALFEHYAARLRWPLTLTELETKKNHPSVETRQAAEAELLSKAIPQGALVVALDERGKQFTSREWAAQITQFQDSGERELAIIIGGADGLDDRLRKQARLLIAFGRATWPHMLVRAMVAEQLYRAQTILDGHPYHRD